VTSSPFVNSAIRSLLLLPVPGLVVVVVVPHSSLSCPVMRLVALCFALVSVRIQVLAIHRRDPISSLPTVSIRSERLRSLKHILSSSVLPIPRQCSALTTSPPHVSSFSPLPPLLTFFPPIQISGDVVVFRFVGGNHSVSQSTLCAFLSF